jgi:hypothetical protein
MLAVSVLVSAYAAVETVSAEASKMCCMAWCNREGCSPVWLVRLVIDIVFISFKLVLSLPLPIEIQNPELKNEKILDIFLTR